MIMNVTIIMTTIIIIIIMTTIIIIKSEWSVTEGTSPSPPTHEDDRAVNEDDCQVKLPCTRADPPWLPPCQHCPACTSHSSLSSGNHNPDHPHYYKNHGNDNHKKSKDDDTQILSFFL